MSEDAILPEEEKDVSELIQEYNLFLAAQEEEANPDASGVKSKRKRAKKKKKTNPYDENEEAVWEENEGAEDHPVFTNAKYEVGYDINILLDQIHGNTIRVLQLVDVERKTKFCDYELVAIAAAMQHNTSVVGVMLDSLNVTAAGLVPLLKSLSTHPRVQSLCFRSLDAYQAGKALTSCVHNNVNIIHVDIVDCHLSETTLENIDVAIQFNAMHCPNPEKNPYEDLMVTAKDQQDENLHHRGGRRGKKHRVKEKGLLEQLNAKAVCAHYMKGCCKYGSRCLLYHPEAQSNSVLSRMPVLSAQANPQQPMRQTGMGFTMPHIQSGGNEEEIRQSSQDTCCVSSEREEEDEEDAFWVEHLPLIVCGACLTVLVLTYVSMRPRKA